MKVENDTYLTLKRNLTTLNNIIKKTMRENKKEYYHQEFAKYSGNCKQTWKTISLVLNKKSKKEDLPQYFLYDDIIYQGKNDKGENIPQKVEVKISDGKTIADQFNIYFGEIGMKLADTILYQGNKNVSTYLTKSITSTLQLHQITTEEVISTINEILPKNSTGVDNLSTKMLKRLSPVLSEKLMVIINQSILTGIFPDRLKIAIVTPIYKQQGLDLFIFNSYRPITLLPAISKVFEKIIHKHVYNYFSTNQLFLNSQYGFRKSHSTEFASMELVDRIAKDVDGKKIQFRSS